MPTFCQFVIAARAPVDRFFAGSANVPISFQTLERGVERRNPQRNGRRGELFNVTQDGVSVLTSAGEGGEDPKGNFGHGQQYTQYGHIWAGGISFPSCQSHSPKSYG